MGCIGPTHPYILTHVIGLWLGCGWVSCDLLQQRVVYPWVVGWVVEYTHHSPSPPWGNVGRLFSGLLDMHAARTNLNGFWYSI